MSKKHNRRERCAQLSAQEQRPAPKIEWELKWNMTDKQAEALRREIMAIIEVLLRRESHTSNKIIRVIAMVEVLAFVVAAFTSREDDEEEVKEILNDVTYNLKRSVRQIRAADAAQKLIARLQAKQKRTKRRKSTRNPD